MAAPDAVLSLLEVDKTLAAAGDARHKELLAHFDVCRPAVHSATMCPGVRGSAVLVATQQGGYLQLVDAAAGSFRLFVVCVGEHVIPLPPRAIAIDAAAIAAPGRGAALFLAQPHGGALLRAECDTGAVGTVCTFHARPTALVADGDYVVAGDGTGDVAVFRATPATLPTAAAALGEPQWRRSIGRGFGVESVGVARDVACIAVSDGAVKVCSIATGEVVASLLAEAGNPALCIQDVAPYTDAIALATGQGSVSLWAPVRDTPGHHGTPNTLQEPMWTVAAVRAAFPLRCAASRSGFLALGGADGRVALLDCTEEPPAQGQANRSGQSLGSGAEPLPVLACFDLDHAVLAASVSDDGHFVAVTCLGDVWRWPLAEVLRPARTATPASAAAAEATGGEASRSLLEEDDAPGPVEDLPPQPTPMDDSSRGATPVNLSVRGAAQLQPAVPLAAHAFPAEGGMMARAVTGATLSPPSEEEEARPVPAVLATPCLTEVATTMTPAPSEAATVRPVAQRAAGVAVAEWHPEMPSSVAPLPSEDDRPSNTHLPPLPHHSEPEGRSSSGSAGPSPRSPMRTSPLPSPARLAGTQGPALEVTEERVDPEGREERLPLRVEGLRSGRRMDPRAMEALARRAAAGDAPHPMATAPTDLEAEGNSTALLARHRDAAAAEVFDAAAYRAAHPLLVAAMEQRHAVPAPAFPAVGPAYAITCSDAPRIADRSPTRGGAVVPAAGAALTETARGAAAARIAGAGPSQELVAKALAAQAASPTGQDLLAPAVQVARRKDPVFERQRQLPPPVMEQHLCHDLLVPPGGPTLLFTEVLPVLEEPRALMLPLPVPPTPLTF